MKPSPESMTAMQSLSRSMRAVPLALLLAALLVWGALASGGARAHEMQPVIVSIETTRDGALTLTARMNIEAFLANIGAGHEDTDDAPTAALYNSLRAQNEAAVAAAVEASSPGLLDAMILSTDGAPVRLAFAAAAVPEVGDAAVARLSVVTLQGRLPLGAQTLVWQNTKRFGDAVLRVSRLGEPEPYFTDFVAAGEPSAPAPLDIGARQATIDVVVNYVIAGFDHIVPKGLDHILFVVGLFLLSTRLKPLLLQITCFTLAHSLTLALGALGLVQVSAAIVEPLIAASIVFVAVENLFTSRLQVWRPAVVFSFGLLHGLGFASVLADFGLPDGQFVAALAAFNVGVEIGQLTVIGLCFALVGFWFGGKPWYRRYIVAPASIGIALVALFWLVERTGMIGA